MTQWKLYKLENSRTSMETGKKVNSTGREKNNQVHKSRIKNFF